MPYPDLLTLNNNVSEHELAINQWKLTNLKNPGIIAQGEHLISYLNGIYFVDDGGTATAGYVFHTPTLQLSASLTGLPQAFSYSKSRQGWIKLKDDLGVFHDVEVIQYSFHYGALSTDWSGSVFKVLSVVQSAKTADYEFQWGDLLQLDNNLAVNIEGSTYGETPFPGINIGSNGTQITASYNVTLNDTFELAGKELYIKVTVRQENASGSLIQEQEATRGNVGLMTVPAIVIGNGQITGTKIWIKAEMGSSIPV